MSSGLYKEALGYSMLLANRLNKNTCISKEENSQRIDIIFGLEYNCKPTLIVEDEEHTFFKLKKVRKHPMYEPFTTQGTGVPR